MLNIMKSFKIELILLMIMVSIITGFVGFTVENMLFPELSLNGVDTFTVLSSGYLVGFFAPIAGIGFLKLFKTQLVQI
jgi:hypothetical protein